MVRIDITYEGDLHCTSRHGPSGASLPTDAPKDNEGKGESFSPTDLVAAALGSCILTTMGIVARRRGIRMEGAQASVVKHMTAQPERRIGKLEVEILMPAGIAAGDREVLEKAAHACPVHRSLNPGMEIPVSIRYAG